jgi:hypothetical protein
MVIDLNTRHHAIHHHGGPLQQGHRRRSSNAGSAPGDGGRTAERQPKVLSSLLEIDLINAQYRQLEQSSTWPAVEAGSPNLQHSFYAAALISEWWQKVAS